MVRSNEQKCKSLQHRWFKKVNKPAIADAAAPPASSSAAVTLKCNTVIKLLVKKGGQELAELFRVLSFCNKHCNKWHLTAEQTLEWSIKVKKKSYRLNVRMIEVDQMFDSTADVVPGLSSGWKQEQVFMTVDATTIKEVMHGPE